ncbi:MobF family relaxase [Acidiphilium sp. PM]|uniref:MobF family relaxase n=1 Tax=Acidiphilium sp. PM TaxID=1043206 RepID=UPI000681B123|nr:MobF family relaxase [Acidiphilium sp. PM]
MISYSHLTAQGSGQGAGAGASVAGVVRYLEASRDEPETGKSVAAIGYYQGRSAPSAWLGSGAAELGLSGEVDGTALMAVLSGKLPDGTDLSGRGNRLASRRLGHDLTISAPKSVSILALAGGDARLLEAHDEAVREAAGQVERLMLVARRGKAGAVIERTGRMVAAAYRHEDSRPIDGMADPQIHTHLVIANMTQRSDGVWSAASLDFGVRNETLHLMDVVYKAALARRAVELGYSVERTRDGFEIAGLTREQIAAFSRRTAEIDRALTAGGLDRERATAAQRVRANVSTRLEKGLPGELDQRYAWRARAREVGVDLEQLRHAALARERGGKVLVAGRDGDAWRPDEWALAREVVTGAARHLSERASVFSEADLMREALLAGMGMVTPAGIRRAIEAREGGLVAGSDARRGLVFTTREALETEHRVLELVQSGRDAARPLGESDAIEALLAAHEDRQNMVFTGGQREAVRLALGSADRHLGIVGAAGSGKTRSMAAIVETYRQAGYEVIGLAPSAAAARELGTAGCDRTLTLEAGLRQPAPEMVREGERRLYVLDEAGMVSARDMDRLMRRAEVEGARTLMVGDPRQLASVEAGSPFQQMLEANVLRHVRMDEVRRQRDPALREIVQRFARGDAAGAVQAAQPYMTVVGKDQLAVTAAEAYLGLGAAERADTLVLAGTKRMRAVVNAEIRTGLRARGEIGRDELSVQALDKADFTREQARRVQSYESGMVVVFTRPLKDCRAAVAERGSQWEVVGRDGDHVTLRSLGGAADGAGVREIAWRPSGETATAYHARALGLAEGERIVFRENDRALGVNNGMGGVVTGLDRARGEALVRSDAGAEIRISMDRAHVIDHGYCRTIHSSQGATVERTIVVGEAGRVATAQTAYVAASRERSGLRIITDDREKLSAAWSRWAERQSARSVLARGPADEPGRQRDMPVSDISRERARQKTLEQARQRTAEAGKTREAALEKQAERQRSTREANHRQGRGMEI